MRQIDFSPNGGTTKAKGKRGRKAKTRIERFEEKVDRSKGCKCCHPWKASLRIADSYPQFWDLSPATGKPTMRRANRVAMEIKLGRTLADGEKVLHTCSNKQCVNPDHLYLGTLKQNSADAVKAGAMTGGKLTEKQAKKVAELFFKNGVERCHIAERFGISYQTINAIISGKTWSHATGIQPKAAAKPVTVEKRSRSRKGHQQLEARVLH